MLALKTTSIRRLLAAAALGALALAGPASAEIDRLDLIAPANPGGGWDQTARAMQTVLQEKASPPASRSRTSPAPAAPSASRSS